MTQTPDDLVYVDGQPLLLRVFDAFRSAPKLHSVLTVYLQLLRDQVRREEPRSVAEIAVLVGLVPRSIYRALAVLRLLGLVREHGAGTIRLAGEISAEQSGVLWAIGQGAVDVDVAGGRLVDVESGCDIHVTPCDTHVTPTDIHVTPGVIPVTLAGFGANKLCASCATLYVKTTEASPTAEHEETASESKTSSYRGSSSSMGIVKGGAGGKQKRKGGNQGLKDPEDDLGPPGETPSGRKSTKLYPPTDKYRPQVEEVVAYANKVFGTKYDPLSPERFRAVKRAIVTFGYTVEELKLGIDSARVDPWWSSRRITDPLTFFRKHESAAALIAKGGKVTGPYDKRALHLAYRPLDQVEVEVW